MPRVLPFRKSDPPPAMHTRAMDNLQFIRETMEAAATFTAVSGWGTVCIGLTALIATALSALTDSVTRWVFIWLFEAVLSVAISIYAMVRKARVCGGSRPGASSRKSGMPP